MILKEKKADEARKPSEELERYRRDSSTWRLHPQQEAESGAKKPNKAVVDIIPFLREQGVRRALVIGCGAGADVIFLAEKGFDVAALDFSKEALGILSKKAREEKLENVHILGADAAKISARDGYFDAVLSINLLMKKQILQDMPKTIEIASETARVLKPAGILLFVGLCSSPMHEELVKNFNFPPGEEKPLDDEYHFHSNLLLLKK